MICDVELNSRTPDMAYRGPLIRDIEHNSCDISRTDSSYAISTTTHKTYSGQLICHIEDN
eukprot:40815-Amorphochlora_amoeboformis.AAC.1